MAMTARDSSPQCSQLASQPADVVAITQMKGATAKAAAVTLPLAADSCETASHQRCSLLSLLSACSLSLSLHLSEKKLRSVLLALLILLV